MIVGRMLGIVIFHIICQREAPSTTADSYKLGLIPAIYAQADVCRPDLLVEIEGVAFSDLSDRPTEPCETGGETCVQRAI